MNYVGRYVNIPKVVYTKAATYNLVSSTEEVKTLDVNGGSTSIYSALFSPAPATAPTGYTSKAWTTSVNEDNLTGKIKGYEIKFDTGRSEVLQIPTPAINTN